MQFPIITLRVVRSLALLLCCCLAGRAQEAVILFNQTGSRLFLYQVEGVHSRDQVLLTFCDREGTPVAELEPITLDLAGHINCFDLPDEYGVRIAHVTCSSLDLLLRMRIEALPVPGKPDRSATVAFRSVRLASGPWAAGVYPEHQADSFGIRWEAYQPSALAMLPVEGAAQKPPPPPVDTGQLVKRLQDNLRRLPTPEPAVAAPAQAPSPRERAEAEEFGAALNLASLCTIQ